MSEKAPSNPMSESEDRTGLRRVAVRTSIVYWVASALWILFSDQIVAWFVRDAQTITRIQSYKGWAFVTATALLLYVMLRAQFRLNEAEAEKRRRADQARKESEERMRIALTASKMGVWDYDLVQHHITWDEQMLNLYQIKPGEFTNDFSAWEKTVHPDDLPRARAELESAIKGDTPFDSEFRIIWPSGEVRHIRAFARVVQNDQDRPARMFGINFDMTEQRKLEEQLRQSQKMEAIGQLAGGVAHDFNNLLTIIYGYAQNLLAELPEDNRLRDDLEKILLAGEKAAALTRQLLTVSRRTVIEAKVIDLNHVVVEAEGMLRRIIPATIEMTVSTDPEIGTIRADAGLIGQVILNLVVNARDAMPRGGTLAISTSRADLDREFVKTRQDLKPGNHVCLTVTDTGDGMKLETLSHIFEPFFTTKEPGKGTGLGLATVFGIVKQSGGHTEVDSKLGSGTSFKIYLPVVVGDDEQPDDPKNSAIRVAESGAGSILVVEDEEAVRAIAVHTLQRLGYQVLQADCGREALRILESHAGTIDLLLTDVVMPGMSGRQLAQTLQDRYPKMRVLFMSGYTSDTTIRDGVREGEFHFLQKPFKLATLAKKVEEMLVRGRRLGGEPDDSTTSRPELEHRRPLE